jgi:hypothetical protein
MREISPDDLVLRYFPEMEEEDVDWVLFNKTMYPFGSIDEIDSDLSKYSKQLKEK